MPPRGSTTCCPRVRGPSCRPACVPRGPGHPVERHRRRRNAGVSM